VAAAARRAALQAAAAGAQPMAAGVHAAREPDYARLPVRLAGQQGARAEV